MSEKCPRCSLVIEKKGKFCPRCGAALDPKAVRATPQSIQPYYPERPKQTFSLVGFGLALGGLLIWFLVIPGLIFGIIGLKEEPAGKAYAKAAIWVSSVLMGVWLLLILGVIIVPIVLANYYL